MSDPRWAVSLGVVSGVEITVDAPDSAAAEEAAYDRLSAALADRDGSDLEVDLGHGVSVWVDFDATTMRVVEEGTG